MRILDEQKDTIDNLMDSISYLRNKDWVINLNYKDWVINLNYKYSKFFETFKINKILVYNNYEEYV